MLTQTDALLATIGTSMLVHLTYNRLEPRKLFSHFGLLIVAPWLLVAVLYRSFPTVLRAIVQVHAVFAISLSTSVVLYRLSPIHPLAKFPGPLISRVSGLWMSYKALDGKRYLYFKALHDRYGPYVRTGPNTISIVDANTITPILGAKGLPRGPMYTSTQTDSDGTSIVSESDISRHAERRKIWNRGFTSTALKGYDEIIFKRSNQLVERLGQQTGVVDLSKWIGYFNFDFMGDLTFGGGFEMMQEGGDSSGLWAILLKGLRFSGLLFPFPWIAYFLAVLPVPNDAQRLFNFAQERVNIRSRTGATSHDLFYHIAETETEKQTVHRSSKNVINDTMTAIVAGSDTTSSVLTFVLYFLMRNPTVKARLEEEVDTFFDRDEEIRDHNKLASMPYLNACMIILPHVQQRNTRTFPPVTTSLQRTPEKGSGGVWIGGMFIPEGTGIFVPPYVLQRDPRYFSPLPDQFWPERWLIADESTGEKKHQSGFVHNTAAFIPFSFGPANCVGKHLAYREMQVVITTIVQKYDFRFAEGYDPDQFLQDLRDDVALVKGKLPVVLTKRA